MFYFADNFWLRRQYHFVWYLALNQADKTKLCYISWRKLESLPCFNSSLFSRKIQPDFPYEATALARIYRGLPGKHQKDSPLSSFFSCSLSRWTNAQLLSDNGQLFLITVACTMYLWGCNINRAQKQYIMWNMPAVMVHWGSTVHSQHRSHTSSRVCLEMF